MYFYDSILFKIQFEIIKNKKIYFSDKINPKQYLITYFKKLIL